MNDTSGFFGEGELYLEKAAPALTVLHSSESGPFVLYRYSRQGRVSVLKAIADNFRNNPLYEDILRKEYEIGKILNHPNIREYCSLTTFPQIGLCIEMEWVEGCTLEELMPEVRGDAELCDKIASQLLDAVRYIHLKQVIHRDIKPSNILITNNGYNVKLIDFSLSDSDSHLILKGNAGTALYASPEQIACQECDLRSDIWSIGVILSEMSGRRHYRRVAAKCMRREVSGRYRDVDALEKALFRRSFTPVAAAFATVILLAVTAGVLYSRMTVNDEFVDSELIDDIFLQATELLEDSGNVGITEPQGGSDPR
ncbi:MAG: serine/threonine protein kinase [Candidatus Cryptobacteroides sp.]